MLFLNAIFLALLYYRLLKRGEADGTLPQGARRGRQARARRESLRKALRFSVRLAGLGVDRVYLEALPRQAWWMRWENYSASREASPPKSPAQRTAFPLARVSGVLQKRQF